MVSFEGTVSVVVVGVDEVIVATTVVMIVAEVVELGLDVVDADVVELGLAVVEADTAENCSISSIRESTLTLFPNWSTSQTLKSQYPQFWPP